MPKKVKHEEERRVSCSYSLSRGAKKRLEVYAKRMSRTPSSVLQKLIEDNVAAD